MSGHTTFRPRSANDEALTTSASPTDAAVGPAGCVQVRLACKTGAHHVAFGGADATTSNMYMPENGVEYVPASKGLEISARTVTGAGVLQITWLGSPG